MTGKESFRTINHCSVLRWVNLKIIWGRGQKCGSQKLQWKAATTKTTCHRYSNAIPKTGRFPRRALKSNCREHWRLTYGKRVDIDDHEVQGHGEGHGRKQPEVAPWGHAQQRLVLRQAWKRKKKGIKRINGLSFQNVCIIIHFFKYVIVFFVQRITCWERCTSQWWPAQTGPWSWEDKPQRSHSRRRQSPRSRRGTAWSGTAEGRGEVIQCLHLSIW